MLARSKTIFLKKIIGLFMTVCWPFLAIGQPANPLIINYLSIKIDKNAASIFEKILIENKSALLENGRATFSARDSLDGEKFLNNLVESLRREGWLLASIDAFFWQKNDRRAELFLGEKYRWAQIRADSAAQYWLRDAHLDDLKKQTRRNPAEIFRIERKMMQHLENQGFAFASVQLDSLESDSIGGLSARLNIRSGPIIFFEKTKLTGDATISTGYLSNFLGIRAGSPYRFSQLEKIPNRLRSSPFLEMTSPPTVTFIKNQARVNLFLKKKRTSRFDFLIGLLPQNGTSNTGSNLLLTGQATAEFWNPFGQGERIFADFQRLRPETQRLDLEASWPFMFGQPFGLDGRFHLYRRDSTFLEFQADGGIQYGFEGGDFVKIYWENRSANLLKINVLQLKSTQKLPPNLDTKANTFGIETNLNRLDYRFNPRRGWATKLRGGAGFRQTIRNNDILKLSDVTTDFSAQYDSLTGKFSTARGDGKLEFYQPIFKRCALKMAVAGGGIFSKKRILLNEQFRLGGQKILRGYDEESVFATRYIVSTLEFRLLVSQNSFFSIFSDYGYIENLTNRTTQFLHPLCLGAGLSFETKAGIFGLNLAVGKTENAGFDARSVKVHLGYLNLF
jgi:outer membrane protein assembly factor BamA